MGSWPVRCAPVGSVAVGSLLWRYRGELRCTVIVKATYAMPETGEMTRINPQPIRRKDDYLSGKPSLAGAAETAPRLTEAGAVVVAHAYNHEPDGAKKRSVRFTIVRSNKLLVDKTLYVYGDRVKGGAPKRFHKMPLGYERALGGLDFSRNPVGVGMDKGSKARPNVINPRDPKRAVGGFGPLPARFPRRKHKLGDVNPKDLESGILELPDDFNWDYFQPAPRDQRIRTIRGDEWLMLEGMHEKHARIRVRIPKARGVVRIYQLKPVDAPAELDLVCDTLHIEPDRDRCSLTWRADFPIASELAASALVLAGAVAEGQEPIDWPARVEELSDIASPVQTGKPLMTRNNDPLYSTALSPGEQAPAGDLPRRQPPPPPRRQKRTPPPPMPPASVPPPPAWQQVARHSSPSFPAVREPASNYDSVVGVASDMVGSGAAGSGAYPSYPGSPSQHEAPSYASPSEQWQQQQAATAYQAPVGLDEYRAAPPTQQPMTQQPPTREPATVASPTGTIPAPPPEDEVLPDPFRPFEITDEIADEEESPFEHTDPMEDEEDNSELEQTKVADGDDWEG